MSRRAEFIKREWLSTRRVALVVPFWIAMIVGINIWNDVENGRRFDFEQVLVGLGMMAFAGVLYLCCRAIFTVVLKFTTDHEPPR